MRGGVGAEEKMNMTGMRQMGTSLDGEQRRVRLVEGQDTRYFEGTNATAMYAPKAWRVGGML